MIVQQVIKGLRNFIAWLAQIFLIGLNKFNNFFICLCAEKIYNFYHVDGLIS